MNDNRVYQTGNSLNNFAKLVKKFAEQLENADISSKDAAELLKELAARMEFEAVMRENDWR